MALMVTAGLAVCMGSSCATGPAILVDGIEIYEKQWKATTRELERRATFDLQCPANDLNYRLIEKYMRYATRVGVSGCQRQISYQRMMMGQAGLSQWVANGAAFSAQPP